MSASTFAGLGSASLVMTGVLLASTALLAGGERGVQPGDLVGATVMLGLPPALAVGLLVRRSLEVAVGHDVPQRLLGVATAGLRGRRRTWGAAMRAELAAVDDRGERRRFAVGCALAAMRTGVTRSALLVAATAGAVLAAITFVSSRMSLGGDRSGSLFGVLVGVTPLVLVGVACVVAFVCASFRAGLEYGFLSLLAALVGIVAVAMPEGARWAETGGIFILDGDATRGALTAWTGALDALLSTLTFGPAAWVPWPVIGAALGLSLRRRMGARKPVESDEPSVPQVSYCGRPRVR